MFKSNAFQLPLLLLAESVHSACECTFGKVPIPVDVNILVDPANANTSALYNLQKTFDIYSVFCQPTVPDPQFEDSIQLLVHGQTLDHQYWDTTWTGFQNYSYVAHACGLGLSTFAFDQICAGQSISDPPGNSTECQIATAGNVTQALGKGLKDGSVLQALTGSTSEFKHVVGVGHSLGSITLNQAIIGSGNASAFDGVILTGAIHDTVFRDGGVKGFSTPASQIDPARWGDLDNGYISIPENVSLSNIFGPNTASYSPKIAELALLSIGVGSEWIGAPGDADTFKSAFGYSGPVMEVIGDYDPIFCLDRGSPCNQTALQSSEQVFFPDSRDFQVKVLPGGCGHLLNWEFCAKDQFDLLIKTFKNWAS